MVRSILATVAGLVAGSVVNMAIVTLNTSVLFPMPAGTSFEDPASFAAWVATLPPQAFLVVLAAHVGQALVGGWVAARLATPPGLRPAMVVGGLTALGSAVNMLNLPGPAWMWADVPLCVVAAYGAWMLEVRRRGGHGAS